MIPVKVMAKGSLQKSARGMRASTKYPIPRVFLKIDTRGLGLIMRVFVTSGGGGAIVGNAR